jgi:hypothetical protein
MNNDYFKQAELALAAYSNLDSDMLSSEYRDALQDSGKGLSSFQATKFASTYRVVDQFNDPGTGLSATIFADIGSGKIFLAVRGTEADDIRDFATGVFDIMLFGSTQLHPQYSSLKAKVAEWLSNGTLPPVFTVTGHSMGGFLAVGLVDDPVFAANVSHAYLYNAPGMGGIVGSFADMLLGFMGLSPTGDSTKISNIEAATGISPTAGLGFDAAPPVDIIIEDQTQISGSPPSKNYSVNAFGNTEQNISQSYSSAWRLAA